MDNILFIGIIIACIVFIVVCILRRRPDLIVNFILRGVIGTAGICLLDLLLSSKGYGINVGVNAVSALTNGFLGLPGFILLYGLAIYYHFGT